MIAGLAPSRLRRGWLVVLALAVCAAPVVAQQRAPGTVNSGQIENRIQRDDRPPERTAPETPGPVPAAAVPPSAADVDRRFTLSAVNVTGATVYPVGEFAPAYEDYLGREIGPPEIEAIIAAITKKYRDEGYFLSRAVARPQDLELGILEVDIVEGRIEEVRFTGADPGRRGLLEEYAAKIRESVPAKLDVVERYILLISDLAGVQTQPSIDEPEVGSGAFVMTMPLAYDPVDFFVAIDNRGTHSAGPLQFSFSTGLNSLAGGLERIRLSAFTVPDEPSELKYGEVYGQVPVFSAGTQLWMLGSYAEVDTFDESQGVPQQGEGRLVSTGFWHPFVRQRGLAIYLNGRFDVRRNSQTELNANYDDRLSVGRVGGRLWFKDSIGGETNTVFEYSQGFDILDASPTGQNVSRTGGESVFRKYVLDVNRLQRISADFWLEGNFRAQTTPDILLSAEEFAIGGSRFGRAYDPSEISDSDGIAAAVEARWRLPVDEGFLSRVWVYGFYDIGAVWRVDDSRESLASAGGGVRFFQFDVLQASLEWAKPLTHDVFEEQNRDGRLFFSVSASF